MQARTVGLVGDEDSETFREVRSDLLPLRRGRLGKRLEQRHRSRRAEVAVHLVIDAREEPDLVDALLEGGGVAIASTGRVGA